MDKCCVCGSPYGELHHIIFRSQCKHMTNLDINFKYLCAEHHRGNNSPHKNKSIDLKYKSELQNKLFEIFDTEYVTLKQLQEKLNIKEPAASKIVKTLRIFSEGYASNDVVKLLLGGRFYSESPAELGR